MKIVVLIIGVFGVLLGGLWLLQGLGFVSAADPLLGRMRASRRRFSDVGYHRFVVMAAGVIATACSRRIRR